MALDLPQDLLRLISAVLFSVSSCPFTKSCHMSSVLDTTITAWDYMTFLWCSEIPLSCDHEKVRGNQVALS